MTTKSSNLRDIPQELNMGQNEEETEWLEHLQKHCISLGILQELEALSLCVRNLCHVTKNDLLTFTPVNIGDLLKLGNITHSNMYLAEETDTTSVSSTCTTLPNSRMLLIGCITRSSTTVTNDRDGVLVVKDCKDCVKCQIREVDSENIMSLLDSWVIFTKWNLLNSGREKILEICCPPVLLESPLRSGKKNIQVLTVEDAHYLLQNKETLNPGLVNIVGTVTAMSEKFRVKNDTLFLIKLADKVNILIKRKEYLHWQLLLIPQKEYVFINLRPTTLKKGGSSEVRIYVPWDRSSVSPKDQCKCFFVSSQEWVTNPAQSTGAPEAVLPDSECVEETLFSYQGEITNTDKLHDGILELDGKVRLFLCYIPPSYTFQSFRLGARITIHKAHRRGSVKPPRINLICCMMSCIKIAEFSPLDHQSREPQYPIYLQELLFHHGIAFSKLSYLLDLVADLRAKLCPKYISSTGKVMSVLLKKLHPDWFKEKNRKLLMEFLSHQGACLMKSKKTVEAALHFPKLSSVGAIQDLHESLFDAKGMSLIKNNTMVSLNDHLYWLHIEEEMNDTRQVLIGCLQLSPLTGRIQLVDKTGAIDVVCASMDGVHACDQHCHGNQQSKALASSYCCPFVQTSILNSVIATCSYTIVRERFMKSNFPTCQQISDNRYVLRRRNCVYVQFSMLNCHHLGGYSQNSTFSKLPPLVSGVKRSLAEAERYSESSNPHPTNHSVFIICKESVKLNSRTGCDSKLRFCVTAYIFEENSFSSGNNKKSKFSIDSVSGSDSCLNIEPKSGITKRNNHEECSKHVSCENRTITAQSTGNPIEKYLKDIQQSDAKQTKQDASLESKVEDNMRCCILLFRGRAVRWYNVLLLGCMYKLWCPGGEADIFKPKMSSWLLKKASTKSGMKSCIALPEDVEVELIPAQESISPQMHDFLEVSQSQVLPVLTVSQVSSESPPDSLVSFQGLLVSRSHCEPEWMKHEKVLKRYPSDNLQSTNEKYGLSTLDNKVMKLIIRDCERSEEMPVYINLENISYPLGLVPGVVAEFSRMEKKISKRGRSYCSFIAVSSIRVLQMSKSLGMLRTRSAPDEPSATLMPTSYKGNMDSVPLLYLSQLWNNKVDTFRTICQIQQVTKLSVKSVCENCGELFGTAGCTVTACSHRTSKLQVRISIIVDDGTGVVMVTCNNIMVQHLLQLSVREWQGLEDFLKGRGEVLIYQNSFSPVNDLEKFLYRLCNSTGIKKKAWMMHLSLPYSSRPSDQTNTCAQLDTNTMDLEEFSYKTIDTGLAKFETRSLPLLHLYCQSLKPVLAVHWTMENLAS